MLSPEVTAAAIAAAGLYALYRLVRFATADADLAALGKRPPAAGSFEGKVVWLVGASQGMGEVIAKYFSAHGARVVLSARKEPELRRVAAECGGEGRAAVVALDIKAGAEELRCRPCVDPSTAVI